MLHISLFAIWGVDSLGLDPHRSATFQISKNPKKSQKFMSDITIYHQEAAVVVVVVVVVVAAAAVVVVV